MFLEVAKNTREVPNGFFDGTTLSKKRRNFVENSKTLLLKFRN